ncbi:MAG: hypothetical protein V1915_00555 [Candidatus Bathyarchaeota archaeon]
MRKSVSFSLDMKILEALKKRADRHHLSQSRELENILRKALRI